jgi:hypothetical protein
MPIRTNKSPTLAGLLLGLSLFTTMAMAQDASSFNIAEFNQILDSINQAHIPENVKDQLFRDMKTSMLENVRTAKIPEDVKRVLIKDLESTTRK